MRLTVIPLALGRFASVAVLTACLSGVQTPAPERTTPDGPISALAPLSERQREWVDSTLVTLSLRQRVGQMVVWWLLGDYTNSRDATYAQMVSWIERDGIGGITMSLGTPVEVAAKVNDLQRRARVPLIIGSDLEPGLGRLEGGLFTHYLLETGGGTVMPPAMAIAATGRDEDAYDAARVIAREGRAVGIHMNYAPVVDVNNNPSNPVINTRSFGEDPARVARLSAAFVRGTQAGGELATAKHFPGHGDTDVDSHAGLPVVGATMARLDSIELVPFRAAIAAGASLVMTAHIALPAIEDRTTPATLSPRVMTSLLRDSLGFRGVTISDALTMEGVGQGYTNERSAVLAVKAGVNILLKPSDPTRAIDAVVAAVESGEISRARIDSAARSVLELKARVGLNVSRFVSLASLRDIVGAPEHRAVATSIASRAVTLLRDNRALLPLSDTGRFFGTAIRAGRTAQARARTGASGTGAPVTQLARITPAATRDLLDSLGRLADGASTVVVAAYVRRVEGEGRVAVPQHIASWIDSLARRRPVAVVALGNPYLLGQFPSVAAYLTTYGVSDDLERAAARALLGDSPITGRAPVSLPGLFKAGDGIQRAAGRR
jgi:beta-N-acetylhexosaminidase